MKTRNAMQFKSLIKKTALDKHITPQLVLQNYMMERILNRIAESEYRNNFILKGGFLISSIVGLDTRTTMDMDTTLKGIPLKHEVIRSIFEKICSISIDDSVKFEITDITDIRESFHYPGVRVRLIGSYPPIKVPLSVDVTSGDIITPEEITFSVQKLFDQGCIAVLAYTTETILAEKIETILSRNVANTRPRDFYDVFILHQTTDYSITTLKKAIEHTVRNRGSSHVLENLQIILSQIDESSELSDLWEKYSRTHRYAAGISYQDVCTILKHILTNIFPENLHNKSE